MCGSSLSVCRSVDGADYVHSWYVGGESVDDGAKCCSGSGCSYDDVHVLVKSEVTESSYVCDCSCFGRAVENCPDSGAFCSVYDEYSTV